MPARVRTKMVTAAVVAMGLVQTGAAVAQLHAGSPEPEVTVEVLKTELGLPADEPLELAPAPAPDAAPDQRPGAAPDDDASSAGE